MTDMNNQQVIDFTKNTLGCTCPDEVFQNIKFKSNIKLTENITLLNRINIGNRLLIYIIEIEQQDVDTLISKAVNHGINDRDKNNFNRVRIVLLSDSPEDISKKVYEIFNHLGPDEKTHLHIIPKDQLDGMIL